MMIYWFLDLDLLKNKPFLPMRAVNIRWRRYYFFYFDSSTKWKTSIHDCLGTIPLRWIWTACSFNKSSRKQTFHGEIKIERLAEDSWLAPVHLRQVCFSEVVTNSIPSPIAQACVCCTSACAHMYSVRAHRSQCEVDRADALSFFVCLFSSPLLAQMTLPSLWFAVACGWEHEAVRRRN